MIRILKLKAWSPYAVGAAIGVLSWFAFATADHPLGITTAFEHTAGIILGVVPGFSDGNSFYEQEPPKIGWQWMLVLGVFLGALLSATLSGDRDAPAVPPMWQRRFGSGKTRRYVAAFLGGALMLLGARLAGGCTSGHGISGTLQLAAASWLFALIIFAVGIGTAFLIYGGSTDGHV